MSSVEQLRRDALALPEAERAELVQILIESLEQPLPVGEQRAFDEELARRMDDLLSGRVAGISSEDLFARLDARLASCRK